MKKGIYVYVGILCLFLYSCGFFTDNNDTAQSAQLSKKYGFYENSVSSIRDGCNVSPEEADNIFLVLVNNCGVDQEIRVTPSAKSPYTVKYGSKMLSLLLNGSTVSEVFDGEVRIFPAGPAETDTPPDRALAAPESNYPVYTDNDNIELASGSEIIIPESTPAATPAPTAAPTPAPTAAPTPAPTAAPTPAPTAAPTPAPTAAPTPAPTAAPTPAPTVAPTPAPTAASSTGNNFNTYDNLEQQNTTAHYVLNTNSLKIHYPSCRSVPKIAPKNYATSDLSLDELKSQGYTTCGICFK